MTRWQRTQSHDLDDLTVPQYHEIATAHDTVGWENQRQAFTELRDLSEQLARGCESALAELRLGWSGNGAEAFAAEFGKLIDLLDGLRDSAASNADGMREMAIVVEATRSAAGQLDEEDRSWQSNSDGDDERTVAAMREGVRGELRDTIKDADESLQHLAHSYLLDPPEPLRLGGMETAERELGGTATSDRTVTPSLGHGHGPNGEDGVLGIAPEAKVKSVAIYPTSDPRENSGDAHDRLIEGIRWLADEGVDVISISLGGPGTSKLEDAVDYAVKEKDVPIVASAGNSGEGLADDVIVQAPAGYDSAFSITGSSREGEFWEGSVDATSIDNVTVAAPAEGVVHAWNDHGYDDNSGTSDSAAIVAGTVALMKAQWPDMSYANIEWRLTETADDVGKEGPDLKTGFGIVNPYEALTAHVEPPDGIPDEQINPDPNPKGSSSDDSAANDKTLTASTGPGAGLWISIAAAVAVLAAAVITIIVIRRRRSTPTPPPMG